MQAQSISGTVSDENGVPLPGATVLVEGTQNGVSTDFDGNYSIDASSGDTLVFSFVGYSNQSVVVGSSATVNVSLQPDNALSEVVLRLRRFLRELQASVSSQRRLLPADSATTLEKIGANGLVDSINELIEEISS